MQRALEFLKAAAAVADGMLAQPQRSGVQAGMPATSGRAPSAATAAHAATAALDLGMLCNRLLQVGAHKLGRQAPPLRLTLCLF